jgi:hypothetical protein
MRPEQARELAVIRIAMTRVSPLPEEKAVVVTIPSCSNDHLRKRYLSAGEGQQNG